MPTIQVALIGGFEGLVEIDHAHAAGCEQFVREGQILFVLGHVDELVEQRVVRRRQDRDRRDVIARQQRDRLLQEDQ